MLTLPEIPVDSRYMFAFYLCWSSISIIVTLFW